MYTVIRIDYDHVCFMNIGLKQVYILYSVYIYTQRVQYSIVYLFNIESHAG
jgi:hypothetical protein